MTSFFFARSATISAHTFSSQSRRICPLAESISSADPILTTMRLALANGSLMELRRPTLRACGLGFFFGAALVDELHQHAQDFRGAFARYAGQKHNLLTARFFQR